MRSKKEINKGKPPFDDVIGSIRCGVRLARNIIEDLPSAQPEYYDYSDIEPLWKSFAEENDINLTSTAKQLKDAMWCGYRKGKADAQSEQRWIPCSERLPEDYDDVLVWFEYFRYGNYNCMYQTYGISNYSRRSCSWMINHESGWHKLRVIAWMPLPEPYREEGE